MTAALNQLQREDWDDLKWSMDKNNTDDSKPNIYAPIPAAPGENSEAIATAHTEEVGHHYVYRTRFFL